MASRRMCNIKIIDSDDFIDMSISSQALYFHLIMRADDDGFVSSPKKIVRMINCNDDNINDLLVKGFIIKFESGVYVVTHWNLHNCIQKDRYTETMHLQEKQMLSENKGVYSLNADDSSDENKCIQTVSNAYTQVRVGKVSDRVVEVSLEKGNNVSPKTGDSHNHNPSLCDDIASETDDFIPLFFEAYRKFKRIEHPCLKPEQLKKVQCFFNGYGGFEIEDKKAIISEFFEHVTETDHNINHFATEGIIQNCIYNAGLYYG